jgi:ribonucleotide reductase beta subunit family protein with ferritin-like domain
MAELNEPLLIPDDKRYVMFPIRDADVWKMYKKHMDSFWRQEEIDLSKDMGDWDKLTADEKHFISMILAFFASSDGVVAENLSMRFMGEVQLAEARAFYAFQNMMEQVHSESYSTLIDTYIQNKDEKQRLFEGVKNFACIAKKANWGRKWISDQNASFATRLVAFAIIEGVFFSASFASIFWLRKQGKLPGLCLVNDFISRDEGLHTEFAVLLYSRLLNKLSANVVHSLMKEAVEIEKEFITESLPCRLIGMNSKLMCQYIEFVADRLCLQLGYNKIYDSSNPFDFMELISIETKVNFFERTNTEYALANKQVDNSVFDFNAEF